MSIIYTQRFKKKKVDPGLKGRLKGYGISLNRKKSKGEIWFKETWIKRGMLLPSDKFNQPFEFHIPDVSNLKYQYIIEIDGKYHQDPEQWERDRKRQYMLEKMGMKVFRIPDMDFLKYLEVEKEIKKIRSFKDELIKMHK